MKTCPFCAEQIQDAAIKCRYCGSLVDQPASAPVSRVEPSELPLGQPHGPTLLGLSGSAVLFLGVFAPIVSAPIIGSLNFFQNGKGDGVIVIILAALSVTFTLLRRFRALWLTGFGALTVMLFTFVNFQMKLAEMKGQVNSDLADNPFKGLADAAVQSVQLQWGWAVLVLGAGMLIGAAALSPTKLTPQLKKSLTLAAGLAVLATVVNYTTDGYLTFVFAQLISDIRRAIG